MHVLGITGAGTHTRACIMEESGEILGLGRSGPSSIDTVSFDETANSIKEAVFAALNRCRKPVTVDAVCCCLGGITHNEHREQLSNFLKTLPVYSDSCCIRVENDMMSAWASGNLMKPCISLILSTGTVCYARDAKGNEMKSGGWGYKTGDPGSAYNLGMDAICYMLRAYDGRLSPSPFTEKIFENLGLTSIEDITQILYSTPMTRTQIAALAPTVTEYANHGDPLASQIIDKAVHEAACTVKAVYNAVFKDKDVLCTVTGSLGNSGGYYGGRLLDEVSKISPHITLVPARVASVFGACLLALDSCGKDITAAGSFLENYMNENPDLLHTFYPLKLNKSLFEKVWGGRVFHEKFGLPAQDRDYGELWEVSINENTVSTIQNGIYTGSSLRSLIEEHGTALVGERVLRKFDTLFPLLIKYLDVNDRLSVQVHPDDSYAKKNENSPGKAEIWYILEASDDAELVLGLKNIDEISRIKDYVENGTLENYFNTVKVKKGDSIYVEPGLIHATYKGSVLIYEVQENSNITYRIYDYNRLINGEKRELHIEKALDVIRLDARPHIEGSAERRKEYIDGAYIENLMKNEYFFIDKMTIFGACRDVANDSFKIYSIIDGSGRIKSEGFNEAVHRGDTFFIPAGLDIFLEGSMELIKTWV